METEDVDLISVKNIVVFYQTRKNRVVIRYGQGTVAAPRIYKSNNSTERPEYTVYVR